MPKTPVLDPKNNPVYYKIYQISSSDRLGYPNQVQLEIDGTVVGTMKYSFYKDCVWINRIDNHYSVVLNDHYHHISYAFLDYAFKLSLAAGKGGRIKLYSILKSAPAYFKWGMRKENNPQANENFAQLLATKKNLSEADCSQAGMTGTWYLPESTIAEKKYALLEKKLYSNFFNNKLTTNTETNITIKAKL